MKRCRSLGIFILLFPFLTGCSGQIKTNHQNDPPAPPAAKKIVGGGCDGCELMYVGIPSNINPVDTSTGWSEKGQKLLLTGTVYKLDGKTPAKDVIIYYWQTDNSGFYTPADGMDENAKRHGHIRGWVKSDEQGKYSIFTIRPAPYPGTDIPAHIHLSVKEPDIENEYYTDELVFDDDKLLTGIKRKAFENRGGSGVLRVLISGELQIAEHNIICGLNIPDYPETIKTGKQSGLQIGEDNPSFIPFHAWGPDKGKRACPVCKYGRYHGILYFVGNKPQWEDIKKWLAFLEKESIKRSQYLKVYFVYGNEKNYSASIRQGELEALGKTLNLKKVALTYVPSMSDTASEVNLNKINPDVENTFVIYRHRTIVDKFIDLQPTAENFHKISEALDETTSEYFHLPVPEHQ